MQLIRCTQKLLKELRVKPTESEPEFGTIGDWHANLLRFEGRKCVLFTNSTTRYSIIIPGLKRPNLDRLDEIFRQSLFKRLRIEGFSQSQIEKILVEYQTLNYAKTNNRSVLGSMNDLAFQIEAYIETSGGLSYLDFDVVNDKLNRIPMGAIEYKYSIDALKHLLDQSVT
jgi:hypothetical protein